MANGSSTVRRTLQFKFTLPTADATHLASMLRAAAPFFEAWGGTDDATVEGRKRLSTILFS